MNNLISIDSVRRRHRETARDRRPRNGHHADCPYSKAPAEHCSVCAGIAKGGAT